VTTMKPKRINSVMVLPNLLLSGFVDIGMLCTVVATHQLTLRGCPLD
jgi:hypothetical protein